MTIVWDQSKGGRVLMLFIGADDKDKDQMDQAFMVTQKNGSLIKMQNNGSSLNGPDLIGNTSGRSNYQLKHSPPKITTDNC